ncbi:hypothetical protein [Vreelandella titanicae]|uniref:Uncharacterized protein n=1 Tax=Vreelandella titanicae TaxID=664683 RepID=A0A558J3U8_9GAMM|nr:hypothetical protein [Halomonas titanicae]TVU88310.1 hypothetical protein FQP89_18830 [Halomonas titanicae]
MSAKQTTKAATAEQSAEKKAPPVPRKDVQVRVKTKATGARRSVCGSIFTNEWKYLTLDDKGSAYKAISADPALVMEEASPPTKAVATDEPTGKEAK